MEAAVPCFEKVKSLMLGVVAIGRPSWKIGYSKSSVGSKDTVALLIKNGADVNLANVRGQKSLDYANIRGFNEIAALILGKKPNTAALPKTNPLGHSGSGRDKSTALTKEDIKSRLKELKELFEEELISEAEYNEKKKELLNKL